MFYCVSIGFFHCQLLLLFCVSRCITAVVLPYSISKHLYLSFYLSVYLCYMGCSWNKRIYWLIICLLTNNHVHSLQAATIFKEKMLFSHLHIFAKFVCEGQKVSV